MEYFIGTVVTLGVMYFLSNVLNKQKSISNSFNVRYSQSSMFELIRPYILNQIEIIPLPLTQAMRDVEQNILRVLYFEEKAYWIENNQLFEAEAPFGDVNKESAIKVDTMGMDDVQLKRTMFIVEKLREGLRNDFGYPGDTQI